MIAQVGNGDGGKSGIQDLLFGEGICWAVGQMGVEF